MPRPPLLYNWKKNQVRHAKPFSAGALSIAFHAVLIAGAVQATEAANDAVSEELPTQPFMLALMNRAPKNAVTEKTIFADLTYQLEGARQTVGEYVRSAIRDKPGDDGKDKAATFLLKMDAIATDDSIFTSYEVDQIAEALFAGAGPVYPSELSRQRIEGLVIAQYVVDTSGWADTSSVNILQSTNPLFTNAVIAALSNMRFKPARIHRTPVRQLVQQNFIFRMPSPADTSREEPARLSR